VSVPAVTPELPSRSWRALLTLMRFLPQAALSRGLGQVADVTLPPRLRPRVLGTVARALGIDVGEAELPIQEYPSINAFFVRRLRAGARPIAPAEDSAVSPVDGVVGQFGAVGAGRALQAKGRDYSVAALLRDEVRAERYRAGSFITIYLSPRHYHRIHAPTAGALVRARHVPGALWPVNEPAVTHVTDLFPRNERVIAYLSGPLGLVALVAVGAYNVGRISAVFDPDWRSPGWASNRRGARGDDREYQPPPQFAKGEELMAFHLGSTVILLFEPGVRLRAVLAAGDEVRLGMELAYRVSA
jgi:phosphatidylserine decarboxylase